MIKKCTRCGEEKGLDQFGRNKASTDGRAWKCLQCVSVVKKRCTRCGEKKSLDEFHRNKASKDGRKSRCCQCTSDDYCDRIAIPKAMDECGKVAISRYIKNYRSFKVGR